MKKNIYLLCMILCMALTNSCSDDSELEVFSSLYGMVTETESGHPVYNATITLAPGGRTTISGADGAYQFDDIDAGQYTLTVQKDGYVTNRKTVTAVPGEKVKADIPLTRNTR